MRRRALAGAAAGLLLLTGCSGSDDGTAAGGPGASGPTEGVVRMARADWETGWFQAALYAQLLDELGYEVSDPAELTRDANTFYPALAQGQVDMWVNGWFPLHDIYLKRSLFSGQEVSEPIEQVGYEVRAGALQGYMIDKKTADERGITSMSDLADADVAALFDLDDDGRADLHGCNEGWGCNVVINEHLDELDWGSNVEQVVGDYRELVDEVVRPRVESGDPVLFYTWTPNWTIDVLTPGTDVVWLESPALPDDEGSTEVPGLDGCAASDPCDLGWPVNDIRAVANTDFLDKNPRVRDLLEAVELPLDDIAEQNARMVSAGEYSEEQIQQDAETWIAENRDSVDQWLQAAGG